MYLDKKLQIKLLLKIAKSFLLVNKELRSTLFGGHYLNLPLMLKSFKDRTQLWKVLSFFCVTLLLFCFYLFFKYTPLKQQYRDCTLISFSEGSKQLFSYIVFLLFYPKKKTTCIASILGPTNFISLNRMPWVLRWVDGKNEPK